VKGCNKAVQNAAKCNDILNGAKAEGRLRDAGGPVRPEGVLAQRPGRARLADGEREGRGGHGGTYVSGSGVLHPRSVPRRDVLARLPVLPRARLAALGGAWLLAVSGCGSEPPATDASHPPPGATTTLPSAPASAALRIHAGRVSVARDQVLQLVVLEELAGRAGFELEVGAVAPRNITLHLDDAPLLDAISVLLEGMPFRTEYAVDPKTGAHVLAKLSVGAPVSTSPPVPDAGNVGDAAAEIARKARSEEFRELFAQKRQNAEERGRLANASAEERRAREAEAVEQLDDADGERRAEALAAIDPEGDASVRISELAKLDPDPRVRAAAVERLGEADTYQATSALLAALADPSPQVLIAALEALEFVGDHSLLPRIEPLANHPNPAVREAASAAIDSLR